MKDSSSVSGRLCLLNSPLSLRELMLRPTMDTVGRPNLIANPAG